MPVPLIVWAGVVVIGAVAGTAYVAGEAADKAGDAAEPIADAIDATNRLALTTGVLAGSYLAYKAMNK